MTIVIVVSVFNIAYEYAAIFEILCITITKHSIAGVTLKVIQCHCFNLMAQSEI